MAIGRMGFHSSLLSGIMNIDALRLAAWLPVVIAFFPRILRRLYSPGRARSNFNL